MKKLLPIILLTFFILSLGACKKKGDAYYYPKSHFSTLKDKEGKPIPGIYMAWGEKLAIVDPEGKETITIQKGKDKKPATLLKTKRLLDGSEGYVDSNDVEIKPMAVGVILKDVLVFDTPSETARVKQAVKTAMLAFVIASKGGEKDPKEQKWYKIKCYTPYPLAYYKLANEIEPIYGEKWIKANEISTNEKDVNIIVGIHMSVRNFRVAKAEYDQKKDAKSEKYLADVSSAEKLSIENLISSNMESETVKFARQALDIISGSEAKPAEVGKPAEEVKPAENQETQKNNESGLIEKKEGD